MVPTALECVMLCILSLGAFAGIGVLAVKVGEAEEERKHE